MICPVSGPRRRRSVITHCVLLSGVLLSGVSLAACSSDSDSSSSSSTSAAYCEAIQTFYDTASPYVNSTLPPQVGDQMGAKLVDAAKVAPEGVGPALAQTLAGDEYARDNFDAFNKSECNVDTASLRFEPTP
jgi:hypothetical protein